MKTDPRTRYTREIITTAFWQLLQQKPMEKITVKEVCTLAQINRGTFYRHFRDCYDLMEQLEEQALEQLEAVLVSTRPGRAGGFAFHAAKAAERRGFSGSSGAAEPGRCLSAPGGGVLFSLYGPADGRWRAHRGG